MGKQKIIWSQKAKIKLFEILEFYNNRNKSKRYSSKLYSKFNKELKTLFKQPHLGIKTEIENVRALIVDDYMIFYEKNDSLIIVHVLWDCRQNPNDLAIF